MYSLNTKGGAHMGLGDNIRYLRIKHGYSQDYVAEKLGYKSYTTIQKWESGVSEPPVKKLKELSILFNADMNDMANSNMQEIDNPSFVNNDIPKIMKYFNSLNDLGKHEAEKRVEELTYIPQYTLTVQATHNDFEDDPEEQEKMKSDLASLTRPE